MKGREQGPAQVGLFPWGAFIAASVIAALILFGRAQSHPLATFDPEARVTADAPLRVADLGEVLRYGRLPRVFTFRNKRYEALTAAGYGSYLPLIRTGTLPDGHLVYYERGALTSPLQTLYLRLAADGPGADVYVRYRLAPQLVLP